jgi:hypothetical protein
MYINDHRAQMHSFQYLNLPSLILPFENPLLIFQDILTWTGRDRDARKKGSGAISSMFRC